MIVVVAEKPNQAEDIANAILLRSSMRRERNCFWGQDAVTGSKRVLVAFAKGHLLELAAPETYKPEWKTWAYENLPIYPPGGVFRLAERDSECATLLRGLAGLLKQATEIVNACDAGREGELIFWEIIQWIFSRRSTNQPITRMWIQDPTPAGLLDSFGRRRPGAEKKLIRLRDVAFLRQEADWLYGINLSRYATLAVAPTDYQRDRTHSIGRVQTAVLGLIADRCQQVAEFEAKTFYRISCTFFGSGGHFTANMLAEKDEQFGPSPTQFKDYDRAVELSRGAYYTQKDWTSFEESPTSRIFPPAPFSLVDLQRAAFRIFGWSSKYTLRLAQSCYAKDKSITYPRTESHHIGQGMMPQVQKLRGELWAKHLHIQWPATQKLLPGELCTRHIREDAKMEEHHAIIPTGAIPSRMDETGRNVRHEYLLWDLITRRFVLSLEPAAEVASCKRILEMHSPDRPDRPYRATVQAQPLVKAGWLQLEDVIDNTKGYGKSLGDYMSEKWVPCDNVAELRKVSINRGLTERPEEFTDDTILGAMEEMSLGTAATRADCLEKLVDRRYIERSSSGHLSVMPLGGHLVTELRRLGAHDLLSPESTAQWEKAFERIEDCDNPYTGPEQFIKAVLDHIEKMGAVMRNSKSDDARLALVYCPASFRPIEEEPNFYIFPGYPKVQFPKVYCGREMKGQDWRDVLTSNPKKGAGPYEFRKRGGGTYTARVSYTPKKTKWGHFKLMFGAAA